MESPTKGDLKINSPSFPPAEVNREKDIICKDEEIREEIPLMESENEHVRLTPEIEDAIVGPETFTRFGIGPLKSQWLQKLAKPETYLIVFSLASLAKSVFFTYSGGTLSTIERRFQLPSSVSGFISTGNDILQILLSIPLAYAAGYGHRPRWMGGGLLLSAFGAFLMMLPHLLFGAGDYDAMAMGHLPTTNGTSDRDKSWASCGSSTDEGGNCEGNSAAIGTEQYTVAALQFLGQVMAGLANVCFDVVGFSYLDEAVSKAKLPLYFAISGCMRIFGPVVGTALASYALNIWVELGMKPSINPSHPQWIGAWWLGYPITAILLILASISMMMMPRQLPRTRTRLLMKLRAAAKQGKGSFDAFKETLRPLGTLQFKDMLPGFRRLSKNKLFLVMMTNQIILWTTVVGYFMFKMKYMENQFNITASESNKYMALGGIVASLVGWLCTGSILTLLKPSNKSIIFITMAMSLLCMTAYIGQMTIKCERDHVIGLDAEINNNGQTSHFFSDQMLNKENESEVHTCMANCNCPAQYSPVCVNKIHQFFSACHAGCERRLTVNGSLAFEGCKCAESLVSDEKLTYKRQAPSLEVRSGLCSTGCDKFIYFVVSTILGDMFFTSHNVIAMILFLRTVDERDKDVALGILNVITSVSFILVPIIMGSLIDYSCILWQRTCNRRGYCYLYDLDKFPFVLYIIPIVGMIGCLITEGLLLPLRQGIDFFGQDEIEELQALQILKTKVKEKMKKKRSK